MLLLICLQNNFYNTDKLFMNAEDSMARHSRKIYVLSKASRQIQTHQIRYRA